MSSLFITGGSGFLGQQVVRRLLDADPSLQLSLLLRRKSDLDVNQRLAEILGPKFSSAKNVTVVPGDVTLPRLGLGDTHFEKLAASTTDILHCAASTELNQSLPKARAANVGGTVNALELAERSSSANPRFGTFFHVSTAYVAGDTERTVSATDLTSDGPFRNYYEQSKAEAEVLVRAKSGQFPVCIFRPSVIVGDSKTGETSSFNVIYAPARLFSLGTLSVIPALPTTPFDVVPIDYVADAIVALMRKRNRQFDAFHLSAGVGRETTVWEIMHYLLAAIEQYGVRTLRRFPVPEWLPPEMLNRLYASVCAAKSRVRNLERLVLEHLELFRHILPFLPYMIRNPRFLTTETVHELRGLIEEPPLFEKYGDRLFKYCLETNWGAARA